MAAGRKPTRAAQAADALGEAFAIGTTLSELPASCRPRTLKEAYAVQAAFVASVAIETAGWKIGCTSDAARAIILKAKGPFAGRVFLPRCFASGTVIPNSSYPMRGIEGEFAFVLAKNLKPRTRPYTRAEISAAVADLHLAIEIIDSRYTDWLKVSLPELVADLGANGALIVGPPVSNWRQHDLVAVTVTMRSGGRIVGKGRGGDALGHPLDALRWLANNPATKDGLCAGEIVSTGTCTGLHQAAPGDKVSCHFGPLGKVTFAFV
jgi:2-keto-4-pentenoate hydratase